MMKRKLTVWIDSCGVCPYRKNKEQKFSYIASWCGNVSKEYDSYHEVPASNMPIPKWCPLPGEDE